MGEKAVASKNHRRLSGTENGEKLGHNYKANEMTASPGSCRSRAGAIEPHQRRETGLKPYEQEVWEACVAKGSDSRICESSCLLSPSSLGKFIVPSGNHWCLRNWIFGSPTACLTQVEDFVSGRDDSNPIAEVTEQTLILNLLTKTESNNKKPLPCGY